jgi:hypothetical protein
VVTNWLFLLYERVGSLVLEYYVVYLITLNSGP